MFDMKFDVVIGNPPYQGGAFGKAVYKSLWPLFWKRSLELVKEGGIVSLITPLTWCAPTNDFSKKDAINGDTRLWDTFSKFTTVADVTSIEAFFPGVGSTFSMVTVNTSGNGGLSFTDGYPTALGFYPRSGSEEVANQLSLTDNIQEHFSYKPDGSSHRVSIVSSRTVKEVNVEVLESDEIPKSNLHPSLYDYIFCSTKEQANYVKQRILECKDILNKHCRYHGFICRPVLGMVHLPKLPSA